MPRYIFSPWDPLVRTDGKKEVVRDVSTVIVSRKDQWNNERRRKDKGEYTFVCWISEDGFFVNSRPTDEKITLEAGDQVYIKGHHAAGLDFISDVTKQENRAIKEVNKGISEENRRAREENKKARKKPRLTTMRKLTPQELVRRFHQCFNQSEKFTGKIKFFNCSSGVNGGISFAKPAADRMRAIWPHATYIGYADDLKQEYGDYIANPEMFSLQQMLDPDLRPERRKLGTHTGKPAGQLHIQL
jgi:hypothetical protein